MVSALTPILNVINKRLLDLKAFELYSARSFTVLHFSAYIFKPNRSGSAFERFLVSHLFGE
jgi:hypothetical protein